MRIDLSWIGKTVSQMFSLFLYYFSGALSFLLRASFLFEEGVAPLILQLLSYAICGSKSQAQASSPHKGRKEKDKDREKEKERDKEKEKEKEKGNFLRTSVTCFCRDLDFRFICIKIIPFTDD